MATGESGQDQEREVRKARVEQYVKEILPTEYSTGRAVSLWQNWWEVVVKVVDFHGDEAKGLVGKLVVRTGEEADEAWRKMKELTRAIQEKLGPEDKLTESQLDDYLSGVTPTQFKAIVDGITESSLPIYSNSPNERFRNSLKSVTS